MATAPSLSEHSAELQSDFFDVRRGISRVVRATNSAIGRTALTPDTLWPALHTSRHLWPIDACLDVNVLAHVDHATCGEVGAVEASSDARWPQHVRLQPCERAREKHRRHWSSP